MKLKNIPNILSTIRILLVFVFLYVFFALDMTYLALIIFLVAGATDIIDGYLARKNGWITNLGKILDPVADKLMQCTVLISLCIKRIIPVPLIIPFFAKEIFTIIIGLIVIKRRNVNVVSRWYGKFAVCLFYATVGLSFIFKDFLSANPWVAVVGYMPAITFALIAIVAYVKHYSYLKKEAVNHGKLINNIRKEQ